MSALSRPTSLHYLSVEGMQEATSLPEDSVCRACLTRDYPTRVPPRPEKLRFELAPVPGTRVQKLEERRGDHVRCRRAAGNSRIHGQQRLDRAHELVVRPQHVAAQSAVAERGDEPRLRHRLVRDEERPAHPCRDGTGHEQEIGVTRRRHDPDPEALEIRVRAGGEDELVLAAVARTCIDMPDGEATAAIGSLERVGSA